MTRHAPLALALAALVAAGHLVALCEGGGYGRGKPHRLGMYPKDQWYLNHSPAPAANSPMPREFNWGDENGTNYLTTSWNQHIPRYCGSCWAHGTLSMVQDRLKIKKLRAGDTTPDVMLSRQTLLNCAAFKGYGQGCDGGEPLEVFKYMNEEGLPDESCMLYSATDHTLFQKKGRTECPQRAKCLNCMPDPKNPEDYKCWAIERPVLYKLTAYGKLEPGELAMQQEILARGPIVCGIACPDDFTYHYHSSKNNGVFIDKSGDLELDHDIEVVGWGEDEQTGLKHWIARNSWGSFWGELGFFKVQRGVNALQLESGDCWYAEPEYAMEDAVVSGDYEGSMDGLKKPKKKGKKRHAHSQHSQHSQHNQHAHQPGLAAAQRAAAAEAHDAASPSSSFVAGALARARLGGRAAVALVFGGGGAGAVAVA